jgi:isoprenylcysteine carboxyl methyltransferase (ICMT) family protein YpbQ
MHVARHSNHCTYQLSIMLACNTTRILRLFSLIRQIGHPNYLILIHDSIAQSLCCNKEYPYPVPGWHKQHDRKTAQPTPIG